MPSVVEPLKHRCPCCRESTSVLVGGKCSACYQREVYGQQPVRRIVPDSPLPSLSLDLEVGDRVRVHSAGEKGDDHARYGRIVEMVNCCRALVRFEDGDEQHFTNHLTYSPEPMDILARGSVMRELHIVGRLDAPREQPEAWDDC